MDGDVLLGEQGRGVEIGRAPQPLETTMVRPREDQQPENRVDRRAVRDPNEDHYDPERDESHQRPQGHPGEPGQVPPGRIARRPEASDKQRGNAVGLPECPRMGARVLNKSRRHRQAQRRAHDGKQCCGQRR